MLKMKWELANNGEWIFHYNANGQYSLLVIPENPYDIQCGTNWIWNHRQWVNGEWVTIATDGLTYGTMDDAMFAAEICLEDSGFILE